MFSYLSLALSYLIFNFSTSFHIFVYTLRDCVSSSQFAQFSGTLTSEVFDCYNEFSHRSSVSLHYFTPNYTTKVYVLLIFLCDTSSMSPQFSITSFLSPFTRPLTSSSILQLFRSLESTQSMNRRIPETPLHFSPKVRKLLARDIQERPRLVGE